MQSSLKAGALLPAVKHFVQELVLLALLTLLGLVGTGVSHAHTAPTGFRIATTNGNIHVGDATSPAPDATNGTVHVGG